MKYLERLKQQISPNACEGEATEGTKGASVPFVAPESEPLRDISADWLEMESLLAIVGPAYRTPEHEYDELRDAARGDLSGALMAYREMASQIKDAQLNSDHNVKGSSQ